MKNFRTEGIKWFFKARNVAIIGASHTKGAIGYVELENFVKGKFKGNVYAINPFRKKILGIKCLKSIKDVPEKVDLAIIATPNIVVPKVLEECGQKGVKAVVIITAGFAEIGEMQLTKKLEEIIKKYPKMRVIGPNVLGILHIKRGIDSLFNPPYRSKRPKDGKISFISQSGALGAAVLDWASVRDYGISKFVSYGNAMDVDEADLLGFLADDDETNVIVAYIEGVKDGRKFISAAKYATAKKPVIVIKGGLTSEGAKSVASHTASLAGDAKVYEGVFKQCGIVQAKTLKEVFNFAKFFTNEPLLKGDRIQIITNGGGFGVLATDAVLMNKLKLAKMQEKTRKKIQKVSPRYAIIKNPCDLTGDADNERFRVAVESCLEDKNIDGIILILLFQVPTIKPSIDKMMIKLLKNREKPVAVTSAGGKYALKHKKNLEKAGISTFNSPFSAARCLAAMWEYVKYRKKII